MPGVLSEVDPYRTDEWAGGWPIDPPPRVVFGATPRT